MVTKRKTLAAVTELSGLIDEAILRQQDLEAQREKLAQLKESIKATMQRAGLGRHATAAGNEAVLVAKELLSWDPESLKDVLTKAEYVVLCPVKADGEKLRALLDSLEGEKARELRKCARGSARLDLLLRPAPAVADAAKADEPRRANVAAG
jgi:hypothetical protein